MKSFILIAFLAIFSKPTNASIDSMIENLKHLNDKQMALFESLKNGTATDKKPVIETKNKPIQSSGGATKSDPVSICEHILFDKDKTSVCYLNDLNDDLSKVILVGYIMKEKVTGIIKSDLLAIDPTKKVCLTYSNGLHNCKGEK